VLICQVENGLVPERVDVGAAPVHPRGEISDLLEALIVRVTHLAGDAFLERVPDVVVLPSVVGELVVNEVREDEAAFDTSLPKVLRHLSHERHLQMMPTEVRPRVQAARPRVREVGATAEVVGGWVDVCSHALTRAQAGSRIASRLTDERRR